MTLALVASFIALCILAPLILHWRSLITTTPNQAKVQADELSSMDSGERWRVLREDPDGELFRKVNEAAKARVGVPTRLSLDDLLFHAGLYSNEQRESARKQLLSFGIGGFLLPLIAGVAFLKLTFWAPLFLWCATLALLIPLLMLKWQISVYTSQILLYLPIVIEQISIGIVRFAGVEQAIQQLVAISQKSGRMNPVMRLLHLACEESKQSRRSLQEVLPEIGSRSGQLQVKHVFVRLAQVIRNGAGFVKALRDLADKAFEREEIEFSIKRNKQSLAILAKHSGATAFQKIYIPQSVQLTLQFALCASFSMLAFALEKPPYVISIFALLGFLLLPLLTNVLFQLKLRSFVAEFPHFLRMTNGLMQSGFDAMTALEQVSDSLEAGSGLAQELNSLFYRIKQGEKIEDAILTFGQTLPLPEIELFVQSLLLSREGPAQLQDIFSRISKLVQYRYS